MDNQPDPRHVARALALQQLFMRFTMNPDSEQLGTSSLLETLGTKNHDKELTRKIVDGVSSTKDSIDAVIEILAPAWPIEQIAPVDLTILRISIWEAFIGRITPSRVAINEAIELAKSFGGANTGSFVNGALGTLLTRKDLQKQLQNESDKSADNTTK